MPVELPDFGHRFLQEVSVYAKLRGEEAAGLGDESFIDGNAQYGDSYWLHLMLQSLTPVGDADEQGLNLYVDVVKKLYRGKSPPSHSLSDLTDRLEALFGRSGAAWIQAKFYVPKEELPQRGLIPAMMGVSTEAHGLTLTMSGVQMSFDSTADGTFDEFQWQLRRDGTVVVSLDALAQLTIKDRFIVDGANFIQDGLDKLVFGSVGEPHDA